jgi:hypothetical protein
MAGEEAIVIHMLEKKIVRKFRDQCATDKRQAMTLESAGVKDSGLRGRLAKKLVKRGILIPTSNDCFYLDEEAAEHYFRKKRISIIAAMVTAIALALLIAYFKK